MSCWYSVGPAHCRLTKSTHCLEHRRSHCREDEQIALKSTTRRYWVNFSGRSTSGAPVRNGTRRTSAGEITSGFTQNVCKRSSKRIHGGTTAGVTASDARYGRRATASSSGRRRWTCQNVEVLQVLSAHLSAASPLRLGSSSLETAPLGLALYVLD